MSEKRTKCPHNKKNSHKYNYSKTHVERRLLTLTVCVSGFTHCLINNRKVLLAALCAAGDGTEFNQPICPKTQREANEIFPAIVFLSFHTHTQTHTH